MAGGYFDNDTIAAIATSLAGDAGVGVIRLSGPQSLRCAQALSQGFEKPEPRFLHRIEIKENGTTLDDGLGVYFPRGQSFTGEEVVELQLHGGRFLLQKILNLLIGVGGCRLALPGEFSFRAVRNGKMSLAAAEGVRQVIEAKSQFEVDLARKNLSAQRTKEFKELAARILNLLAQTELSIDFIDQDVEVISEEKLKEELKQLAQVAELLLRKCKLAQRIAHGLNVALVGAPNAGKSTVFNALLAEDRAIVSPEAGTTRDVITEEFLLGPYRVRLADTAGIREQAGSIEKEGIERAIEAIDAADLVLFVIDAAAPLAELEATVSERLRLFGAPAVRQKTVVLLNKWDLVSAGDAPQNKEQEIKQRLAKLMAWQGQVLTLGAAKGLGIDTVLESMQAKLDTTFGPAKESFLPTEFQLQMLLKCRDSLNEATELVEKTKLSHPEILSGALHAAARALSDVVGETTPDTVLVKIFTEFCIGK